MVGDVIESLRLQDFRCFPQVELSLAPQGAVFLGENAQGKTSLLEAVCVLLRLQSPRARQLGQLIRKGMGDFGVAGTTSEHDLKVRGDRRQLKLSLDQAEITQRREYLEQSGVVVWMGNSDLELIRGGGEARRRYLDFLAAQIDPEYRRHWLRYRKALQLRNRVLKESRIDEGELRSFTLLLLEHGGELIRRREGICEKLGPLVGKAHGEISQETEKMELVYLDRSKGDLDAAFAAVEESERRRGVTLAGPHRDDLLLEVAGEAARDFASEGQQRTLALALKLAQGELLREDGRREPVYLIDDIFGELDQGRRNALMKSLPNQSQKLVTTTNLDWWTEQAGLPVLRVREGGVSPR